MKTIFDKKNKNFEFGDLLLKWDKRRFEPSKHKKFDNLWVRPFRFKSTGGENTLILENLQRKDVRELRQ